MSRYLLTSFVFVFAFICTYADIHTYMSLCDNVKAATSVEFEKDTNGDPFFQVEEIRVMWEEQYAYVIMRPNQSMPAESTTIVTTTLGPTTRVAPKRRGSRQGHRGNGKGGNRRRHKRTVKEPNGESAANSAGPIQAYFRNRDISMPETVLERLFGEKARIYGTKVRMDCNLRFQMEFKINGHWFYVPSTTLINQWGRGELRGCSTNMNALHYDNFVELGEPFLHHVCRFSGPNESIDLAQKPLPEIYPFLPY